MALAVVAGCGAPTAVDVVLTYEEDVSAARVVATLDDGTAVPEMIASLPEGGVGSVVMLLPDRFGGHTLEVTIEALTDTEEIGARWSGTVEIVTGEVVRLPAALFARCGDGLRLAPEACDDGNTKIGRASCR